MALLFQVDTSKVRVLDPNVQKSFYVHVWTTTHPSNSMILTPPAFDSPSNSGDRMKFYLSLTAMADSDGRGDRLAPFCPLYMSPPKLIDAIRYYTSRQSHIPIPRPTPVLPTLCMVVYEEITTSMPGPGDTTCVDPVIANSFKIQGNTDATHQSIRRSLLHSHRIGMITIPWADLLTAAITPGPVVCAPALIDDRLIANHPKAADRGHVQISIDSSGLAPNQVSLFKQWYNHAAEEDDRSRHWLEELSNKYTHAYVRAFPAFDAPFQLVKETPNFGYQSPEQQEPLVPATANIGDIHMPIVKTPSGPVPLGWYYIHATRPEVIDEMHEWYLHEIFQSACAIHRVTTDEWTATVSAHLDAKSSKSAIGDFGACVEVLAYFLTAVATAGKYRSDFRIVGRGHVVSLESVDFDRVSCASASDDCEGGDRGTQEIVTIMGEGRHDVKFDAGEDRLWQRILLPRIQRVGGWKSAALSACQRLLGYYAVTSILGSVTEAFPGMISKPHIDDMDAAQTAWRKHERGSDAFEKLNLFIYGSEPNVNAKSGAHQYSVAVPLTHLLDMYGRGLRLEERGRQLPFRHYADDAMAAQIKALADEISQLQLPEVPGFLLESTCHASGLLVGLSTRAAPARSLETQQRHWMNDAKREGLTRNFIIQIKDLHAMKIVEGDLDNRRGSSFYRDLLHGTSRRLWQLLGRSDDAANAMTFTFIHQRPEHKGPSWGVPIEEVLRGAKNAMLVPIMHRIPYKLRSDFHALARRVAVPYWPPIRLGKFVSHGRDSSFQCPTPISVSELKALMETVHQPTSEHRAAFDSLFERLQARVAKNNKTLSMPDRVLAQRVYVIPLRATTITGDWDRLMNFMASHGERITYIASQRLIPAFGLEEIVLATAAE